MDARLQRRVQRYGWDKAAPHYEQYWAKQLEPAQQLLLKMAALEPGERVLDVACGTGLVTFAAAERIGDKGEVVGTDLSKEMVEALLEAHSEYLASIAPYRDGDGYQIPGEFVVTCGFKR